jgi:hypothetical protein
MFSVDVAIFLRKYVRIVIIYYVREKGTIWHSFNEYMCWHDIEYNVASFSSIHGMNHVEFNQIY